MAVATHRSGGLQLAVSISLIIGLMILYTSKNNALYRSVITTVCLYGRLAGYTAKISCDHRLLLVNNFQWSNVFASCWARKLQFSSYCMRVLS